MALILMVEWFSDFSRPAIHSNHSFNQRDFIFVDLMVWFGWIYIYIYIRPCSIRSIDQSITHSISLYVFIYIYVSIHLSIQRPITLHPSIHPSIAPRMKKKSPPFSPYPTPTKVNSPTFPISSPSHPIPSHPPIPSIQTHRTNLHS